MSDTEGESIIREDNSQWPSDEEIILAVSPLCPYTVIEVPETPPPSKFAKVLKRMDEKHKKEPLKPWDITRVYLPTQDDFYFFYGHYEDCAPAFVWNRLRGVTFAEFTKAVVTCQKNYKRLWTEFGKLERKMVRKQLLLCGKNKLTNFTDTPKIFVDLTLDD